MKYVKYFDKPHAINKNELSRRCNTFSLALFLCFMLYTSFINLPLTHLAYKWETLVMTFTLYSHFYRKIWMSFRVTAEFEC